MKFEFTEEHEALRSLIAEVCEREADPRACYDSQSVIDSRLWSALCSAGVIGVGVAEAYEGGGAGPVEQVIVAEELGRAVAAIPFGEHSAAAETVALLGSDDQRKRLLIPLARGESVAGIVLPTPANLDAVEARRDGTQWRLDGRIPLIPNAAAATVLRRARTRRRAGAMVRHRGRASHRVADRRSHPTGRRRGVRGRRRRAVVPAPRSPSGPVNC